MFSCFVSSFRFIRVLVVSVSSFRFVRVMCDFRFLFLFFVFSLYHLVPVLIFPPLEILRRRLDLVSIVSSCFDSVWFLRSVYFGSVPSFRFILTGITPPVFVRLVVSVSVPSFLFFSYPCCRGR